MKMPGGIPGLCLAVVAAAGALAQPVPDESLPPFVNGSLSAKLLGEAWELAGKQDHVGALKKLEDATTFLPNDVRDYFDAGVQAQAEGRFADAQTSLQRAVEAFPPLPEIFAAIGHVRRAAGDYLGAVAAYDIATFLVPRYPFAIAGRAEAKHAMEDYEGAIADFSLGIQLSPKSGLERLHLRRGMTYLLLGEKQKAAADFETAVEIAPDYQSAHVFLGAVRRLEGKLPDALAAYEKAIQLEPRDVRAYNGRLWIHYEMGQSERALSDAAQCLELMPGDGHYPLFRAILHQLLGNFELAEADFKRAAELADAAKDNELWFYAQSHLDLMQRQRGIPGSDAYLRDVLAWTDSWQKRLALHLAGRTSAATVINDARQAKRRAERERQACEAFYYVGVLALVQGEQAKGVDWLKQCVATGQVEMVERTLAQAQLRRLETR